MKAQRTLGVSIYRYSRGLRGIGIPVMGTAVVLVVAVGRVDDPPGDLCIWFRKRPINSGNGPVV